SDDQPTNAPQLSPTDAEAIDRMFGQSPGSFVPADDHDHAAINLLSLLATPVKAESQRTSRADVLTLLAARLESEDPASLTLSEADQRALDQYIEQGYRVDSVDPTVRDRAQRLDRLGAMVTTSAPTGGSDLVDRTLDAIQSQIDQERSTMRLSESRHGSFSIGSFRWSDLISVAAMLLLTASVIMPIMSGMRASSQQGICYDNMHRTAQAFGMYTGSNRDMLPMATAGMGPTWMDVGSTPERSNSSNLYTLIRTNMAGLDDLACPSNRHAVTGEARPDAWDWKALEEVSYSYRIMPPGGMRATDPARPVGVVLLADRSPVVLRVARKQAVVPEENSPNHRGSGQHMLMLDGSSQWASTPMINNQDNIWLPRPIEQVIHDVRSRMGIITGNEQPDGPTDAFVGP
ncbi:MAG: hypothetical protein WD114_04880, partial [Phycisphaerales bacterium]